MDICGFSSHGPSVDSGRTIRFASLAMNSRVVSSFRLPMTWQTISFVFWSKAEEQVLIADGRVELLRLGQPPCFLQNPCPLLVEFPRGRVLMFRRFAAMNSSHCWPNSTISRVTVFL